MIDLGIKRNGMKAACVTFSLLPKSDSIEAPVRKSMRHEALEEDLG